MLASLIFMTLMFGGGMLLFISSVIDCSEPIECNIIEKSIKPASIIILIAGLGSLVLFLFTEDPNPKTKTHDKGKGAI